MRLCHFFLRREGVLGIGHLVVFLFHQRITYCRKCWLYNKWQWFEMTNDQMTKSNQWPMTNEQWPMTNDQWPMTNDQMTKSNQWPMTNDQWPMTNDQWPMTKWPNQTNDLSGTFKCARSRCKTCPFIHNAEKISGPERSCKITDHFKCTSAYAINSITCFNLRFQLSC